MGRKRRADEDDAQADMVGGQTVYEFAVKRAVTRRLKEDPRWGQVLAQVAEQMRGDHFGVWRDFVVQKHFRTLDIYDAYCMSCIWTWIMSGWLAHAEINVHHTPRGDSEHDENRRFLDEELPLEFKYIIAPDQTGDGSLRWENPIHLVKTPVGEKPTAVLVKPASVVLEIGFTHAERTHAHLGSENGLARWAYGSECIRLLYWVDYSHHPGYRLPFPKIKPKGKRLGKHAWQHDPNDPAGWRCVLCGIGDQDERAAGLCGGG